MSKASRKKREQEAKRIKATQGARYTYIISYDRISPQKSQPLQDLIRSTIKDNGKEIYKGIVESTLLFTSNQDFAFWVTEFKRLKLAKKAFLIFAEIAGENGNKILIHPNPELNESKNK